jgi:hypothetical protein
MSMPFLQRGAPGVSSVRKIVSALRLPALKSLGIFTGALLVAAIGAFAYDDKAQSPVEVFEWSVWVGNPAQPAVNASRIYTNAMPTVVGTSRPKLEDKEAATRFPLSPVSVVQFYGDGGRDIDVDLKVKQGTFLSHWPISNERGGRLQWFKSDLSKAPPAQIPPSYLPENHWFQKLRDADSALYLKYESHFERFIAYDSELQLAIPLKIRGGPDEYTLQNLTGHRLLDVAVIVPTPDGFRVGWLDELPTAAPEKKKEDAGAAKKSEKEKVDAFFKEGEKKKDDDEPPPLPAEGDATVKARVDQQLNRPVVVTVEKAPRREVLEAITGQVRLRYELDDKTLAKADINLSQTTSMNASGIAARDALADLLGNLGLSYRVADDGRLFITTAARLSEEATKKGTVIEGPPVKLTMPPPMKASNPSYAEVTRHALARRMGGQGQRDDITQALLSQYGKVLFEPGELIILAHLSRAAIDDAVVLDVFPPPKKLVRTALLVVHGVDPRLQDRARTLVQQLGDQSPKAREKAESSLAEMGPVALPALEDALINKDVEIVFRAERLLLKLNRPVP